MKASTACAALLAAVPLARADNRQSRDDAWWTGPLLAASAGTLPQGHFLIEPYLFDVVPQGRFDQDGTRSPVPHSNTVGSQSYVLYGLTDYITVGLIPRFFYSDGGPGPGSSGVRIGDLGLQGQYRIATFEEGGWLPTSSIVFGETVPTGKYDRLGQHAADGVGAGSYTTTLSSFNQYFFWLPTGRILRTRLDISYSVSSSAPVRDGSVYGTGSGFTGHARPGNSLLIDAAGEYSITRHWVLAFDVLYQHDSSTRVHGEVAGLPLQFASLPARSWAIAPALEYNFNARVGVIAGAKITVDGRNTTDVLIPVAALNIVI